MRKGHTNTRFGLTAYPKKAFNNRSFWRVQSEVVWSLLQCAYIVYARSESPGEIMRTCRLVRAFATHRCNKNHHFVCWPIYSINWNIVRAHISRLVSSFSHNGLKLLQVYRYFHRWINTLSYRFLYGNVQGCVFAKNRPVSLNWTDYMQSMTFDYYLLCLKFNQFALFIFKKQ